MLISHAYNLFNLTTSADHMHDHINPTFLSGLLNKIMAMLKRLFITIFSEDILLFVLLFSFLLVSICYLKITRHVLKNIRGISKKPLALMNIGKWVLITHINIWRGSIIRTHLIIIIMILKLLMAYKIFLKFKSEL